MLEHRTTVVIELPLDILQQEIWDVEEQFKRVEAVETDLREPKDLVTSTMLVLHIAAATAGVVAGIAGGTKTVYEVAKLLYDFLHRSDKEQVGKEAKKKVVIIKKGESIELYNQSIED